MRTSSLKLLNEELIDIKRKIFCQDWNLYEHEEFIQDCQKANYHSVGANPTWYLRQELVDYCIRIISY
jgi:hypothetical protein